MASSTPKQKLSMKQWMILITVICIYFFGPTFGAVSSTLALIPDYYGIAPAMSSWISALANPSACLAGLLVGAFVGRKISYRLCAIISVLLFTVFGGLPFLWQGIPFEGLLASRFLFGLGCGCFNPLVQAIITHMFVSETARSAWIGIINIVFSIGASLGSMITGALSMNGVWQNAYAFYLFGAIPLVLAILFIHDKDILSDETPAEIQEEKQGTEKRSVPAVALAFIFVFMLSTIMTQTFFNYAPMAITDAGADPLVIGTVFTVFTIVGIVVAAGNAALWKFLRLWCFPLAFIFLTGGYAICIMGVSSGSVAMFFVASGVIGVGCCLAGLVMPMVMSVTVSAAALTLAIGLQEVAHNLGSFLSAPWLNIIGTSMGDTAMNQFIAILVFGCISTAMAIVLAAKNNKRFKNIDTSTETVEEQ